MDKSAVLGTLLGLAAIIGGQLLEGGAVGELMQFTAGIIVIGGTLGAVLLSFSIADVKKALKLIPSIYQTQNIDAGIIIKEIVGVSALARKEGILSIEPYRQKLNTPLFKKTIKYVIDGFEPATVKDIIDHEIDIAIQRDHIAVKVFESAGGYAPTIGILGAVLGLIHVMSMLNEPTKIGAGIAVAFVATVYGVALANLIFLPWANKLKRNIEHKTIAMEMVRIGVLGIMEGLNPHFLKEKLVVMASQSFTIEAAKINSTNT